MADEFIESLRDGREVYIYGERVKDVTDASGVSQHGADDRRGCTTRCTIPQRKDRMSHADRHRNGGMTHAYLQSAEDRWRSCCRDATAIAEWARFTYGWIGRSPDYKASFLATLGANADFYAPYQENARRWYKFSQERVPFVNHAIIHPPVDRDRPPERGGRRLRARRKGNRRGHRSSPARRSSRPARC